MSLTAIVLATLSVPRPSDLPCGKRRAFVDLGANDGQSLEWFRKHWEPRAPAAFTTVVAFELNPVFAPVLRGLLARWEGTLVGAAAWTSDGEMAATIQQPGSRVASKGGVLYNMTSSALEMGGVPLNKRARSEHRSPHEVRRRVPTVDLAAWLSARFCAADVVDVKMDIEGAEFEVLEHLLRTGGAALLDSLSVEWHTSKRGHGGARVVLQQRQASILRGLQRAGVRLIEWKDARPQ